MLTSDIEAYLKGEKRELPSSEDFKEIAEYLFSMYKWVSIPYIITTSQDGDGLKKNLVATIKWKNTSYLNPPSLEKIKKADWQKANALALATGIVSGNLVAVDLDDAEKSKDVVEEIRQKYPVLVSRTRRGFHLIFTVTSKKDIPPTRSNVGDGKYGMIDTRGNGGIIVFPPSYYLDPAKQSVLWRYKLIHIPPNFRPLTHDEYDSLKKILHILDYNQSAPQVLNLPQPATVERTVSERLDKDSLVDVLRNYWVAGTRHQLTWYLALWLRSAGVSESDAIAIVKEIAEMAKDTEIEDRARAVKDAYESADLYGTYFSSLYGTMKSIGQTVGMDVRSDYFKLVDAIGHPSKYFGEPKAYRMGYNKYIFVDPTVGEVWRYKYIVGMDKKTKEDVKKFVPDVAIFYGYPLFIVRVKTPYGKEFWKVKWGVKRGKVYEFEGDVSRIVNMMKKKTLVLKEDLARDTLSRILTSAETYGLEYSEIGGNPGFYIYNDKLMTIGVNLPSYSEDLLHTSVQTLDIIYDYFSHVPEHFATVVKWGLLAPFSFAIKQKGGKFLPWLYLFGQSNTGKTTLGEVVLSMWGVADQAHEKTSQSAATPPRLGRALEQDTFPILINEYGAVLNEKFGIAEMVKNAIEGTVSRERMEGVEDMHTFYALAPAMLTSQRAIPEDTALKRRMFLVAFGFNHVRRAEQIEYFRENILPLFPRLCYIGAWIADRIQEDPSLLSRDWMEVADELLVGLYRAVGRDPPEWAKKWLPFDWIEDMENEAPMRVRQAMANDVFNGFRKIGVSLRDNSFEDVVRTALQTGAVPWAAYGDRSNRVYITRDFMSRIQAVLGDQPLSALPELIGQEKWEYTMQKIDKKTVRVISVPFEDFIGFLKPVVGSETVKDEKKEDKLKIDEWEV